VVPLESIDRMEFDASKEALVVMSRRDVGMVLLTEVALRVGYSIQ
jgi:hypothetical protein